MEASKQIALVECLNCHKVYPFISEHRHFDDYLEFGSTCQHCQHWHHLGYYTQELLQRQRSIKNRRQRRAFKRDYDKLQKAIDQNTISVL